MAIEKYRLLPGQPTPSMRPPGKLAIALEVQTQQRVMMRVINTQQLTKTQLQQMKLEATEFSSIKSSIILKLLDFFQEDRYFILIYEFFPFQAVDPYDRSTRLCLLAMCDYLDQRFIALNPLDLQTFGVHEGVVKVIPPFTVQQTSQKANRIALEHILKKYQQPIITESRRSYLKATETSPSLKVKHNTYSSNRSSPGRTKSSYRHRMQQIPLFRNQQTAKFSNPPTRQMPRLFTYQQRQIQLEMGGSQLQDCLAGEECGCLW